MKCDKCKKEVKKGWKYCPYCGEKLGLRLPNIFNKKIENDNYSFEKEMERMLQAFGFPNIKINFRTYNSSTQRGQGKSTQRTARKISMDNCITNRSVEFVEEPEVEIKKRASEIQIIVILPDVVSVKDIFIRRLSQSIELRAYVGKKMYFKLIPISVNSKIIRKNFSEKKLEIILTNG